MTELELQQHLLREYSQENACYKWEEFKNLKNAKDTIMKVLTL